MEFGPPLFCDGTWEWKPVMQNNGQSLLPGEFTIQWSATGKTGSGTGTPVAGSELYYRVTLDNAIVTGWTKGYRAFTTYASGAHTLIIEATYGDNTVTMQSNLIGNITVPFNKER